MRTRARASRLAALALLLLASVAVAQGGDGNVKRLPAPPPLPFVDNPDPDQCGIPQPLGEGIVGIVTGVYQGEELFDEVHLYASHFREVVTGLVPSGETVTVTMFQDNPVLNYWFVRWDGPAGPVEGWIPEPFLDLNAGAAVRPG